MFLHIYPVPVSRGNHSSVILTWCDKKSSSVVRKYESQGESKISSECS